MTSDSANQTSRTSDRFIFYGFLAMLAWLPMPLGSDRAWAWSIMESWVFLLVIGWLILLLKNSVQINSSLKNTKTLIFIFFLFVLWNILQFTPLPASWIESISPSVYAFYYDAFGQTPGLIPLSVDPEASKVSTLKTITYFLIFLLSLSLLNSSQRLKWLAYVLLISGVFQAVYGSLMTLSGLEKSFFIDKISYYGVATGTFVNRNHLAGYLEMTLAIGIGLMIINLSVKSSRNWRERTRLLILTLLGPKARIRLALVMMVIALVLTRSRMGNSAFFISLGICAAIGIIAALWRKKKKSDSSTSYRPLVILFISLIAIDVFIVGAWFGIDKVAERLEKTSLDSESRDEVSIYSLEMWQKFMIPGTGGGSYYGILPTHTSGPISGFYDHAHNDFLEFGSEFGLIGIALLSILVLASLIKSISIQFIGLSRTHRGMSFGACMGILAIMIHSGVDFNLQIPANSALFVILLSIPWLKTQGRQSTE